MQSTTDTMFVNEKIIMIKYSTEYILFVHSTMKHTTNAF